MSWRQGFGGFYDRTDDPAWRKWLHRRLVYLALHPVRFWCGWSLWTVGSAVVVAWRIPFAFRALGLSSLLLGLATLPLFLTYRRVVEEMQHEEVPDEWFDP